MPDQVFFALEVMLNGLMTGVLYSLVALGFVLIFKATGMFNYAQGVMALFAAMTLVGIMSGQVPFSHLINAMFGTDVHHFGWNVPAVLAIVLTMLVMIGFAFLVERYVLMHLVNQEPIILFMATIGLAYFLEGLGDLMWGSEHQDAGRRAAAGHHGDRGGHDLQWFGYGFFIDKLDIVASVIAAILVLTLTVFSQYTRKAGPCARWRTTIRRRCRWEIACARSG